MATGGRIQWPTFDGRAEEYELWEERMLCCMHRAGLKETILGEPAGPLTAEQQAQDDTLNADAYCTLAPLLDNTSLGLIFRDTKEKGRESLKVLREHYIGKGRPRIVSLYISLTALKKADSETVTEYIIRAEHLMTALRNAGEAPSEGLMIAMIMRGLPEKYKPFSLMVTHGSADMKLGEFKAKLRNFEAAEDTDTAIDEAEERVLKARARPKREATSVPNTELACWRCGGRGHRKFQCQKKTVWCGFCRSSEHADQACNRRRGQSARYACAENDAHDSSDDHEGHRDDARRATGKDDFAFRATTEDSRRSAQQNRREGLIVDTGASSHIVNDRTRFRNFDSKFKPERHSMELADGKRTFGLAHGRGDAEVCLVNSEGRRCTVTLKNALYIPSFPQELFSVKCATANGAEVFFKEGKNVLISPGGTRFNIHVTDKMYYLETEHDEYDVCNVSHDIQTWHEIMGHCNYEDILKLQDVTVGMHIKGTKRRPEKECDVCIQGKLTQTRNREPVEKVKAPLEMVNTDLAGPVPNESIAGFKYMQSFTDVCTGAAFVYFLKAKSDALQATEKFLADVAPYGRVKCIRSDNGTEYTNREFQELLRKNRIRHETSCPYSPHQNGIAEREGRTLFEMARCTLIDSNLPKSLWHYAVQEAAFTRNRCFNKHTGTTPYTAMTGKKSDLSKMHKFGAVCYAYQQNRGKLDARAEKGLFVGHDKGSPALLVYYPSTGKVQKNRLVKFVTQTTCDSGTQTLEGELDRRAGDEERNTPSLSREAGEQTDGIQLIEGGGEEHPRVTPHASDSGGSGRYPTRERKPPGYLRDYVQEEGSEEEDSSLTTVDYCYRAVWGVPVTFREAVTSPEAGKWQEAMNEEMKSLEDNQTFTLTRLPEGRKTVGGKWVYSIKEDSEGREQYKARFVAKGYSQRAGIDYGETFSPTANLTSVRVVMQKAAEDNLILHQMDVKTAYLHAPIDRDIYMEQPEGYHRGGEKLVCKLEKSIYGLKQSGRNWNEMLHTSLIGDNFTQNPADHCVYTKESKETGKVIIVVWVDDLIIAASNTQSLEQVKNMLSTRFKMKDLGRLKYFLGIDFCQTEGCVKMSQKRYVEKILSRYDMQECRTRETPCEQKLDYNEEAPKMTDVRTYREAVGSLIYLTMCTRPDICFVVSRLSQHFADPTDEHWVTVKHVLRYLRGTADKELCFRKSSEGLGLQAHSDADWAADTTDRRSTTGYCVRMCEGSSLVSWKTKKQPTVALSTCEAEYMALALTIQECIYLEQLLKSMDTYEYLKTVVYEDNQGTIALVKNPVCRQRCKHVDIKYHFIRSIIKDERMTLVYCPTEDMVADAMTKPVTKLRLKKFAGVMFGA